MGRDAFAEGRCAGRWAWFATQHLGGAFELDPSVRPIEATLEEQRIVRKLMSVAARLEHPSKDASLAEVEEAVLHETLQPLAEAARSEYIRGFDTLTNYREEAGKVPLGHCRESLTRFGELTVAGALGAILRLQTPLDEARRPKAVRINAIASSAKRPQVKPVRALPPGKKQRKKSRRVLVDHLLNRSGRASDLLPHLRLLGLDRPSVINEQTDMQHFYSNHWNLCVLLLQELRVNTPQPIKVPKRPLPKPDGPKKPWRPALRDPDAKVHDFRGRIPNKDAHTYQSDATRKPGSHKS